MRRSFVAFLTAFAVVALTGSALAAVNPKGDLPVADFDGATVTVTGGNFSGLGNTPAYARLTTEGTATYFCENPTGHRSPGQNPVDAAGGDSGFVQLPTDKNGRATIPSLSSSVTAPATPSAQEVGCGGKGSTSWTVVLDELTADSAHLVITHGLGGPVIFCRNYTADGTGTAC